MALCAGEGGGGESRVCLALGLLSKQLTQAHRCWPLLAPAPVYMTRNHHLLEKIYYWGQSLYRNSIIDTIIVSKNLQLPLAKRLFFHE